MNPYLHGFGVHLPSRIVTNQELADRVGRTADWIENASGIRERRWATGEETVADLAVAAAEDCFNRTQFTPNQIGLLIATSGSAPPGFPGPTAEIAQRLNLTTTPAIDLPIASAGSIFGLSLARQLAPAYGTVLLVATEKMSDLIGVHKADAELDPNTAILFGDGAAAAAISTAPGPWQLLDSILHSDGAYRDALRYDGQSLHMDGLSVILQASRKLPAVIQEVLGKHSIAAQDVGAFLIHQANLNLLTRVGKALGVTREAVFSNVERLGNTSSASMLLAAAEWAESDAGRANRKPLVFAGFGAGFHWGAAIAMPV
ncbi:MAG: ketoacyl-ACP synthase III [Acidobacteriota bacterium]